MRALVFLAVRRFVNSFRRVPQSPRLLLPYLFLLLVFGGQLAFFLLTRGHQTAGIAPAFTPREFVDGDPGKLIATIKAVLVLGILSSLIAALGEGNLFFSQSDVDFLFPTPLSRRAVLCFKMVGRYAGMLLPAVYLPLLFGSSLAARAGVTPLAFWPGILGSWLFMMTTANVAQTVLLRRAGRDDNDEDEAAVKRRERWQRTLSFGMLLVVLGAVGLVLYVTVGQGGRGDAPGLARILQVVNSQAASWLLLPVTFASDLYRVPFEGWTLPDVGRLFALVLMAGGSLAVLFSRDRDFYESAMSLSEKQTRMVQAVRQGNAGTILSQMAQDGQLTTGSSLRTFGTGAGAILWKDALSVKRTPARSWWTLIIIAAFPALFSLIFGQRQSEGGLIMWMFLFTINTSQLFLLGLRDMLRRADITKTFPLSATRLLVSELAFSILQMVVLGWISLLIMFVIGSGRGVYFWGMFLVFPTLATLIIFVQTSFVLLYPASNGDAAQGGVSGLFSMFASIVALIPSIAVGVGLTLLKVTGWWLPLGIAATNLITALVALGIAAMLWERFDPTD